MVVYDDSLCRSDCSIAAAYLRHYVPPRIALGRAMSRGRQLFSVAHEFGHHLLDQDPVLADHLFDEADGGVRLEEDICDAFAAMLLVSDQATDLALGSEGLTSRAVIHLFNSTNASREAAAVAMAQRIQSEGYVPILRHERGEDGDVDLVAQFCARSGAALPITRMAVQDASLLRQASRAGRARGYARLRFPSGAYTDEYHADVTRDGEYLFAVLVADLPPWGGLSVRSSTPGGYDSAWCEHCSVEFRPASSTCTGCGDHQCPQCRRCGCPAAAAPSARICRQCFTEAPGKTFVGDRCAECADDA
ncbi:ImmA/IrrE family metallo-endopeptidase [Mycolicibacterium hippocampi]|uniref:ImmA/IrrE family metallo-endopeptidase n=1 Tax=Mycolicibacterium hippocampi TaxID=659824 RepID=UPI0033904CB8